MGKDIHYSKIHKLFIKEETLNYITKILKEKGDKENPFYTIALVETFDIVENYDILDNEIMEKINVEKHCLSNEVNLRLEFEK
jgi:hypothetical protein